jgi:hypothetical protein
MSRVKAGYKFKGKIEKSIEISVKKSQQTSANLSNDPKNRP